MTECKCGHLMNLNPNRHAGTILYQKANLCGVNNCDCINPEPKEVSK